MSRCSLRRRPLLRAAAVGGGSYLLGKRRAEAEAHEAYQDQQIATAPQPSAGLSSDSMARLQELGKLHEQGILTDEEFAAQKAKLLGM